MALDERRDGRGRAEGVYKIRGNIYTEITRYATNLCEHANEAFDEMDVKHSKETFR